ncbi:Beta-N-acetylhexosaminidase [Actinomyces bovis]|uniref:beta-N-acetylhexosaminidase n=1 Tax=Actinomyces bovis TaxID=1658 RepID=A0ABY1VP55_9ACTO|nr:family 20 glycosylhydrolase [Actinomyces bovis]SPT53573.1 Beta-N-acetylhexosaminidase [Actinomyces bovis]VEG55568.1 Beta-N-acetylhexosaminidase [Actinomyces israelii]
MTIRPTSRLARLCAVTAALAMSGLGVSATVPGLVPQAVAAVAANVALASAGATVTASGSEVPNKWQPSAVIDGGSSGDSRWSSNYSDQAWIAVQLAQPTTIDHVTIRWEAACAAKYHLEVSQDGQSWTRATDTITPTCGTKDTQTLKAEVAAQQWKHVKMQAEGRTLIDGNYYGVSLYELEVWNGPAPVPTTSSIKLVPLPANLTDNSTTQQPFTLKPNSRVVVTGAQGGPAAKILAAELSAATGYSIQVVNGATPTADDVVLATGAVDISTGRTEEAYSLTTSSTGAVITANTEKGMFYGTRTLKQLFPAAIESPTALSQNWTAPAVAITDAPRFEYRSLMIDPTRSFLEVDEVKKIIDEISDLKLSSLHMHLADDQGWRIEITNEGREAGDSIDYTKLTEISGKTAMNMHDRAPANELGRTGYYTQAQYRDLVAYAATKHITVIPEIDLPGHTNAALHAIPELNTTGSSHAGTAEEPTAPANGTGDVGYSYLDPNSPATDAFIKHVLKQLASMTTGPYLHVGGDESHKFVERYGHTAFNQFVAKIGGYVKETGKNRIGWNEIASGTLEKGDGVQYWHGDTNNVRRAVTQEGAKVLMSKGNAAYLDQKYSPKTPIALDWACKGDCDVRHYYDWDPAKVIPDVTDASILGPEGPLWSETQRGGDETEFLMWGRLASHAEIGWSEQADRDVEDFVGRLSAQGARWNFENTNFYDSPQVTWGAELAGTAGLTLATGAEATVPVGALAAPGTKTDGSTISVDSVNDADGTSASAVPAGSKVTIDWGDGSATTEATISAKTPRDAYNAAGLYTLAGTHRYATAGDFKVTLSFAGKTVTTQAHVADGATSTPLPTPWDSSVQAAAEVPDTDFAVGDRVPMNITGFPPNTYVTIKIGDTLLGTFRTDAKGERTGQYVNIPGSVYSGQDQDLTFTAGDRVVTKKVNVTGGLVPLENRLPSTSLTLVAYDSQETAGETPPNGLATAAIDGNPTTFWHTKWQGGSDPFPHYITLGLPQDKTCKVTGFEYQGRAGNANTRVKDYELLVSMDGQEWTLVNSGALKNSDVPQAVNFPADKHQTAKFVKMLQKNSHNGDAFGGAAEIRVGAVCSDGTPEPSPTPTTSPSVEPTTAPTTEPTTAPTTQPEPEGSKPAYVSKVDSGALGTVLKGDWDGDGTVTYAVRVGTRVVFYNENRTDAPVYASVSLGRAADELLVGDWDNDGKDTLALRRGTTVLAQTRLTSSATTKVMVEGITAGSKLSVHKESGKADVIVVVK